MRGVFSFPLSFCAHASHSLAPLPYQKFLQDFQRLFATRASAFFYSLIEIYNIVKFASNLSVVVVYLQDLIRSHLEKYLRLVKIWLLNQLFIGFLRRN